MKGIRWPFGQAAQASAPESKASAAGPLIAFSHVGRARWTPRDYRSLAMEGFAKNAVAYRCVRMIAEAAASAPFQVFVDGARDDVHPLARLLAKPNPEQSGAELMEALYGALQVAGNAYLEATGDDDGPPGELWSLRPDRMTVVPGPQGWPQAWEYAVDGRTVRIGRRADGWSPVMQLKLFHPTDDWYGFSPLEAAAFAIDVHNASGAWNKALLDNAARPSGALVYGARDGERLTAEQFEALKAQLADGHAGAANAGRPLLLEGGMDWKAMSLSPSEMDFIAGKHAAAREIALAFGVPPQLLGIPGDAGGENFDWFYGGDAERAAQIRTPIRDTAHGEDWLFRPKDLKGWWSNAHHDRPRGVRRATPTAWVPGMKPVRLSEFGCAAVDRGGNAPNLFQDPKSSEGRLPPHSSGARDDAVQRAALEAILAHYAAPENNPVSAVYGGRMLEGADAWCWDARPYPAFPARADVWADAGAWRSGHWLNGRLTGDARDLIAAVLRRGGVADDGFVVEGVEGAAAGYLIDRPMRTRDALAPLLTAFDAVAAERGGGIAVLGRSGEVLDIAHDDLALEDEGAPEAADRSLEQRPATARVRFIDEAADYQTGAVTVRSDEVEDGGGLDLDLPVACGSGLAARAARRLLDGEGEEALTLAAGPDLALRVEPGDAVRVEGRAGVWRVEQAAIDETPRLRLRPLRTALALDPAEDWRGSADIEAAGAPLLRLLDLPPLPGAEEDDRPLVVLAAEPWRPMSLHVGMTADSLTARAVVDTPATVGVLLSPVTPGPIDGWDEGSVLDLRVEGEAPESASEAQLLSGANRIAVECEGGGWELMQFRRAEMVGQETWRLSGLLRAQQGTDGEMAMGAPKGALVVFLGAGTPRVDIGRGERGHTLICRAGPRGAPPGGDRFAQTLFTPQGIFHRPWSPTGLSVEQAADGARRVRWTPRARRPGTGWNAEGQLDARRYRIRVRDGDHVVRVAEASVETFTYAAGAVTEDFPGGLGADVALAVAQWGDGYGWGVEARIFIGG